MNNKNQNLPPGWVVVKLEDIVSKISNGANVKQYDEKIGFPITRIETIWNETIDLNRVKYIKENNPEFVEKYRLLNGDILFSHINSDSHLGKTAIFKFAEKKVLIHGINLLLIRPSKHVSADFLNYQFKYLRYRGLFYAVAQKAVNQSSINQKKIKNFEFLLPPLSEQHRIVAKIEELFSSLDKAVERLKATREQLKIYRQAVLKWAFEGRFTHKDIKQGELPEGWVWVKLGEIGIIETGKTPPKNNPEYYSDEYPFYKPTDLEAGDNVTSSIDGLSQKGLGKTRYAPEFSILVTCIGATIGKTGFIRRGGGFNQQINAIIPNAKMFPKFVYYQAISQKFQEQIKNNASATTLPILNKSRFENLEMVVCDKSEQQQIVSEIEKRLSVAEKVEESIRVTLEKAERLRQSILKKAFEGKLVPQDPNDEPASVLLEKIKAEKKQHRKQK